MVCLSVCLSLSAIQLKIWLISYWGTLPRSPSFQKANPPHLAGKNHHHHHHRPTGFAALGRPQAPHPGPCHLLSVWPGHLLSGPGPAHGLSPVVATWGLTCLQIVLLHATDSVDTVNNEAMSVRLWLWTKKIKDHQSFLGLSWLAVTALPLTTEWIEMLHLTDPLRFAKALTTGLCQPWVDLVDFSSMLFSLGAVAARVPEPFILACFQCLCRSSKWLTMKFSRYCQEDMPWSSKSWPAVSQNNHSSDQWHRNGNDSPQCC